MKFVFGSSKTGNVAEALQAIQSPEALLFIVSDESMLADAAAQIEQVFPGVPSIGGVGQSYAGKVTVDQGISVIGMKDQIKVAAGVLEEASRIPAKYIRRLEDAFAAVDAQEGNTACYDLCSAGADLRAVTTLSSYMRPRGYELAGGTSNSSTVACNGKIYKDACAFLVFKNLKGKIRADKENIYVHSADEKQMMVTDADPKSYTMCTLDDVPAEEVYRASLGISKDAMDSQTFKNPFGHVCDGDTYIVSIKEVDEQGNMVTYRPVNKMDFLTILELGDYRAVVEETVANLKEALGSVSAVLSVNCLFRYIMFGNDHYWNDYLATMSGSFAHAGMVGVGEHYNTQFVNQTMCCLAFE